MENQEERDKFRKAFKQDERTTLPEPSVVCVCVCVCACASNSHSVTLSSFSDTSMFPLTYDQRNTEPRADEDAGGPKVPAANKCPSEKGRSK